MWCKFFQKEEAPNLLKIVQFVCSVPVSNAFVERIFSVMGNVWTDDRNSFAVNTVKTGMKKKRVCKEKLTDATAGGTKLEPALTLIPVLIRGKCI
ncbi:hypothetical protein TNCV_2729331 [Trichonephila clavipes]|nr:hypothetical protein TNCV_2729331 [Trichonephila clavipes]